MKTYTEKTIVMKTDNRSYRNVIVDTVKSLERLASKPNVATDEMMTDYNMSYLLSKCFSSSLEDSRFDVVNVRYGKYSGHLCGFDLKMNLEDADIVFRVSKYDDKTRAHLYMGGHYYCTLRCANGAYVDIIDQLYDCAAGVRVAA